MTFIVIELILMFVVMICFINKSLQKFILIISFFSFTLAFSYLAEHFELTSVIVEECNAFVNIYSDNNTIITSYPVQLFVVYDIKFFDEKNLVLDRFIFELFQKPKLRLLDFKNIDYCTTYTKNNFIKGEVGKIYLPPRFYRNLLYPYSWNVSKEIYFNLFIFVDNESGYNLDKVYKVWPILLNIQNYNTTLKLVIDPNSITVSKGSITERIGLNEYLANFYNQISKFNHSHFLIYDNKKNCQLLIIDSESGFYTKKLLEYIIQKEYFIKQNSNLMLQNKKIYFKQYWWCSMIRFID